MTVRRAGGQAASERAGGRWPRPRLPGVTFRACAVLAGLVLLAGCGGSGGAAAAPGAARSTTAAQEQDCPAPAAASLTWPASVPADLPTPAGAALTSSSTGNDGLTTVRFSTDQSLQQGVVHLVDMLPSAGFTLGRGDAEAAEADVPFTRGDVRGLFRMVAREPCTTDWVLAVTSAAGAAAGTPLLPLRPSASTSPLPFG